MCGIFGVTRFDEQSLDKARNSLHTLSHRGPDGWGEHFNDRVYIGHRRLSILDLSERGSQPMKSYDKEVVISVNGEVYNYQSIKKQLLPKYDFTSTSDSEVILHGYREWGIDELLHKIEGMYAFSIYDQKKNELYLVRDRVGIKPLYYSYINKQVVWASELKAIEKFYKDKSLTDNNSAYYDYLTYRYVPAPKTIYEDIFKLEPGHYLKIDLTNNSIEKNKYWSLKVDNKIVNRKKAQSKVAKLIHKSVQEQMISDVPVGFFLSGGLDSSTVVASAAKNHKKHIKTFSIGFTDKSHDETHYADLVAQEFNTQHEKQILDTNSTKELYPELKIWYDEPFALTSAFPTYMVSKIAKDKVTVVLTGDGGDEIFGGYKWYKKFKQFQGVNLPSRSFLREKIKPFKNFSNLIGRGAGFLEKKFLMDDLELYVRLMGGMLAEEKDSFRKKLNIADDYDDYWYFRKYYKKEYPLITRLQYLDFHTFLPDAVLTKVDRASMAVSLECRVPLLATDLIEYMFSLAPEVRNPNFELKGLMKETFKDELPLKILNREKKGFSVPVKNWKSDLLEEYDNLSVKIVEELFNKELG